MIQEAYVSFEISKLLKEKGFDEKVFTYYEDGVLKNGIWFEWNRSPLGHVSAPTHQMAMAWLREVHNIFIEIIIFRENMVHYRFKILNRDCEKIYIDHGSQFSYENAVGAALKYTLENLI